MAANETTSKRTRGRRPTKSRKQIIVPPVDCGDLFEASVHDRDGPLIRKVQHNSECKKFFECVTNRWLIRDCPDGTTFNNQDKNCDSKKSCLPRNIDELYADAVEELKDFMGISDDTET